jgi:hypothetical protein
MSVSTIKKSPSYEDLGIIYRQFHPIVLRPVRIQVKPIFIPPKLDEYAFCIILKMITSDVATTSCSHKFDREAILNWMNTSNNCPRCNREIRFVTYLEKDL